MAKALEKAVNNRKNYSGDELSLRGLWVNKLLNGALAESHKKTLHIQSIRRNRDLITAISNMESSIQGYETLEAAIKDPDWMDI